MTHFIQEKSVKVHYENIVVDLDPWLKEGSIIELIKGDTLIRVEPEEENKGGIPPGKLFNFNFNSNYIISGKRRMIYFGPGNTFLFIKSTAKIIPSDIFYSQELTSSYMFEVRFHILNDNKVYYLRTDIAVETGEHTEQELHKAVARSRTKIRNAFEKHFTILTT
jgi:hypothetical protein